MEIVLKLLDWPVLLFVCILWIVFRFEKEVRSVLARGGLTLSWGEASLTIAELPEYLDKNFAPLDDTVQTLAERIAGLEKRGARPLVDTIRFPPHLQGFNLKGEGGTIGERIAGVGRFPRLDISVGSGEDVDESAVEEQDDLQDLERKEMVREKMLQALGEEKYRWRSLDRLAVVAGISTAEADALLRGMKEVVRDTGKKGRPLFRLASR